MPVKQLSDLADGLKILARGEIRLAKAEFRHAVDELRKQAFAAGIVGAITAAGLLPLVAFFVIGLGKLLDERYWLSSLIVAVVFNSITLISLSRLKKNSEAALRELSLPEARESVEKTAENVVVLPPGGAGERKVS